MKCVTPMSRMVIIDVLKLRVPLNMVHLLKIIKNNEKIVEIYEETCFFFTLLFTTVVSKKRRVECYSFTVIAGPCPRA